MNSKSNLLKIYFYIVMLILITAGLVTFLTGSSTDPFSVEGFGPGVTDHVACTDNPRSCIISVPRSVTGQPLLDGDSLLSGERSSWVVICLRESTAGKAFLVRKWRDLSSLGVSHTIVYLPEIVFDFKVDKFNIKATDLGLPEDRGQCLITTLPVSLRESEPLLIENQKTGTMEKQAFSWTLKYKFGIQKEIIGTSENFIIGFNPFYEGQPISESLKEFPVTSLSTGRILSLEIIWGAVAAFLVTGSLTAILPFRQASQLQTLVMSEREDRENFLNGVAEPIFRVNQEGIVTGVSNAAAQLFQDEAILGKCFSDLIETREDLSEIFKPGNKFTYGGDRASDPTSILFEGFLRLTEGVVPLSLSVGERRVEGEIINIVLVRNESEGQAAKRAAIIEAQRDHALRISAALYHETSRSAIKLAEWFPIWKAAYAKGQDDLAAMALGYVEEAARELPSAVRMTASLSALGASEFVSEEDQVPLKAEDLSKINIDGITFTTSGDGTIYGVLDLMHLMMRNIANNARRHGAADTINIEIIGDCNVGKALLVIRSNGTGVDGKGTTQQQIDSAWNTGKRARGTGFGNGLSIIRRIVEAHRAEIKITSAENSGWTYEIQFNEKTT